MADRRIAAASRDFRALRRIWNEKRRCIRAHPLGREVGGRGSIPCLRVWHQPVPVNRVTVECSAAKSLHGGRRSVHEPPLRIPSRAESKRPTHPATEMRRKRNGSRVFNTAFQTTTGPHNCPSFCACFQSEPVLGYYGINGDACFIWPAF
jgi:hypothetical protein